VSPLATPEVLGRSLGPRMITLSDCIQEDLPRPDPWEGDWFQNLDAAEGARRALGRDDVATVAVAMSPPDAYDLIAEWDDDPTMAPFALLRSATPISPDAKVLGYEVVGVEEVLDLHSWHCHGYADQALAELGVGVNGLCLLRTYEDAQRVLQWMCQLPVDDAPAPVPWDVVALIELESGAEPNFQW
jgi:hypothetical protein